jgi:hypothetical protein
MLRVTPLLSEQSYRLFDTLEHSGISSGAQVQGEANGKKYKCSLNQGFTPFAFLICGKSYWDKYFPPVLHEDEFVTIVFEPGIEKATVRNIANAYIFELSTTLGLDLKANPRPDEFDYLNEADEKILPLRPLITSDKTAHAIEIYNSAIATTDDSVVIILLSKLFEHISQTVVRRRLIDVMRRKLFSPSALNPSASYILELQTLFDQHREYRKDRDAIVLTITNACEPTELSQFCPAYLSLSRISVADSPKDREDALKGFAGALVSTRNAIAHAKSNYTPVGDECMKKDLHQFPECVRRAAQQAVRWFADLPEAYLE